MTIQLNLQSDKVEVAKAENTVVTTTTVSIKEVFLLMKTHQVGSVLICEDNKLVGIFTERDAVEAMVEDVDLDLPISEVMVTSPMTIDEGAPLAEAIRLMAAGRCRRLPIVSAGQQLTGIVKVSGILQYFVEHFPQAVFNLPPEPNTVISEREGA